MIVHGIPRTPAAWVSVALVFSLGTVSARAEDVVPVFLLAGQSNMQGHGIVEASPERNDGKGSLRWLVQQSPSAEKFAGLVNATGQWAPREDVQIWSMGRAGNLRPGFGANEDKIGPELGFGVVVGDAFEKPVLLIKCAWGGKSLAVDFRPPSAGGDVGPYYQDMVRLTRETMENAADLFPQLKGRTLELRGVAWHQGWNDRINQAFNDEYESNLVHLIQDLRSEFEKPDLAFVVAETGMSGREESHPRALSLMKAQASAAARSEFAGTVAFVPTRDFFRAKEESPSGQAYHWNTNAETYYLIGEAMGQAMLGLIDRDNQSDDPSDGS